VLAALPALADPRVLVGAKAGDDAAVFRIASKFLEPESPIRARKEINAPVVLKAFDAGKDEPGFIDAFRHQTACRCL